MAKRPKLPRVTETSVLTKSRRRCCLCFFLDHDDGAKKGQIAHLDQNPVNNDEDNLAYLCFNHHDAYDSRTRIGKGLTIDEVKVARSDLYKSLTNLYEIQQNSGTTNQRVPQAPYEAGMCLSVDLPPLPVMFVGRDDDLQRIRERLGCDSNAAEDRLPLWTLILRGWPGVGKTSISAVLAHDANVRRSFTDGVLWTSLGQRPQLLRVLSNWAHALGNDDLLRAPTLSDAVAQFGRLLAGRRMLLVIDDLWEVEHAEAFRRSTPSTSALLFTTRDKTAADELAPSPDAVYSLRELPEESALELLRILAPTVVAEHPVDSIALVRDLECLPLALHVAGRMLHTEAQLGLGLSDLLSELRDGRVLLEKKAPVDLSDLETQTRPTVAVLLDKSTKRLKSQTRDCFAMLGAFAPKPATFDLIALQDVWQVDDPKPIVRELVARGLLEPLGDGQFQTHSLLVTHAQSLLANC